MGARMADHWAAVAMMAGHAGETSPLNLRNTPFTMWMGEADSAFNRNTQVRRFAARLDSLRDADPGGYVHSLNIVPGTGHWMNSADTLALEWMAELRRNPYPDRVVWRQEESAVRKHFYWLSVPESDARAGMEVVVERSGSVFTIEKCDYPTLFIELNDRMLDLDTPVTVMRDGVQIFHGVAHRREWNIHESVRERGDHDHIFSARLAITATEVSVM
jgi:hypothetical protein